MPLWTARLPESPLCTVSHSWTSGLQSLLARALPLDSGTDSRIHGLAFVEMHPDEAAGISQSSLQEARQVAEISAECLATLYDWQDPNVSDKEIEASVDKISWKKYHDRGTLHFDDAFVARFASKEGTGLQLLQLEVGFAIGQESCMRLPATLRYLSTSCRCGPGSTHVPILVQMELCVMDKHCLQARLKLS